MRSNDEMIALGSQTAKNGFSNERDIVAKFNNWKLDEDALTWLKIMGYKIDEIEKVEAVILHGYKTDVQVKITVYLKDLIDAQGISIKLVSNPTGFNQIDKRWVDKYALMWDIPDSVKHKLKLFTGEIISDLASRDSRRVFFDEMSFEDQAEVVNFFENNKTLIIADIIKGRGKFSANWMMVALTIGGSTKWVLRDINFALNIFSQGDVSVTSRGSLKIGKVTMQRKGGDNGRPTAQMLQFKINPVEMFQQ